MGSFALADGGINGPNRRAWGDSTRKVYSKSEEICVLTDGQASSDSRMSL
jgi:hypothetical protein